MVAVSVRTTTPCATIALIVGSTARILDSLSTICDARDEQRGETPRLPVVIKYVAQNHRSEASRDRRTSGCASQRSNRLSTRHPWNRSVGDPIYRDSRKITLRHASRTQRCAAEHLPAVEAARTCRIYATQRVAFWRLARLFQRHSAFCTDMRKWLIARCGNTNSSRNRIRPRSKSA